MTNDPNELGLTRRTRVILWVTDFDEAMAFYRNTLGLELAYPAGGGWAEFAGGGSALCLHEGRRREDTATDRIASFGWAVADLDAAVAALRAAGTAVDDPHVVTDGLRAADFHDPSGNALFFEGP